MPNVVLIASRYARVAYTAVSPLMRMMKYAVFYNMNYAAHANFIMLGAGGLFSRMVRKPPPEHFRIIIAALPVDLLTIMDNQKCGRSEDR